MSLTITRPSSPTLSITLASAFISYLGLTASVLAYAMQWIVPAWKRELPLRETVPASRYYRRSFDSTASDGSSSDTLTPSTPTRKRPKHSRHVSFGKHRVISFPEGSSPSELATPSPKSPIRPSCLRQNNTPFIGDDSTCQDGSSEVPSSRSRRSSLPVTNLFHSRRRSNSTSMADSASPGGSSLLDLPNIPSRRSSRMGKRTRAATDSFVSEGWRTPTPPSRSDPFLEPSDGMPISRSTTGISESYSMSFDPFRPFKSKTRASTPGAMTPSASARRLSVPFTNPWLPDDSTTPTRTRATFSGTLYETPGTITPSPAAAEQVFNRCRLASETTVRYLTRELDRRLLQLQQQKTQRDASRERHGSKIARKFKHIQKNLQASIPAGILSR